MKLSGNSGPTCDGYICPPTKRCKIEGGNAKCVDDDRHSGKWALMLVLVLNSSTVFITIFFLRQQHQVVPQFLYL